MTISEAIVVYALKTRDASHQVDAIQSKMYGPRVAILKDEKGQRLACIVESKKGFTVDAVKKMHQPPPKDEGWCLRDRQGRFVSKRGY